MTVKCPRCGKPSIYDSSNKYRPFCCERCSILDLGAWADEKYRVPLEGEISESEQELDPVNEKSESESAPFTDLPAKHSRN